MRIQIILLALLLGGCGAQTYVMKVLQEAPTVCKDVIGGLGVQENQNLRWKWEESPNPDYNEVMSTPMVADIDGDGVGDIVVATFSALMGQKGKNSAPGVLRVISGANGKELASTDPDSSVGKIRAYGNSMIAIFDLDQAKDADGKSHPEILVYTEQSSAPDNYSGSCTSSTLCHQGSSGLAIYQLLKSELTGQFKLELKSFKKMSDTSSPGIQHHPISAHRLFHDSRVFIEAFGKLWNFEPTTLSLGSIYVEPVIGVMDLKSGPGFEGMEILTLTASGPATSYDVNVTLRSSSLVSSNSQPFETMRTPGTIDYPHGLAFGQFIPGTEPQVVVKKQSSFYKDSSGNPTNQPFGIAIFQANTGKKLTEWQQPVNDFEACKNRYRERNPQAITNASISGAMNVGDINGDKIPDITFAGACKFYALKSVLQDGNLSLEILWSKDTVDMSSASTGSSNFDFNGDGEMEVLYNDEQKLRIYDGKTGDVRAELANNDATVFEYPVVVSLRPNEPASIVIAANRYLSKWGADPDSENLPFDQDVTGVRIISAKEWMPSRTLWNQFLYTITNVNDDLSVPEGQVFFSTKSNMTRANVQGDQHLQACIKDESKRPPPVIIK